MALPEYLATSYLFSVRNVKRAFRAAPASRLFRLKLVFFATSSFATFCMSLLTDKSGFFYRLKKKTQAASFKGDYQSINY
jgi:hypothetical protein